MYKPNGNRVFEQNDEQLAAASAIFQRMFEEMNSDYIHKYDVPWTLVMELIHLALKIQPNTDISQQQQFSASQRISALFIELPERQFPIDENFLQIIFRLASDFAEQLNVHVNHLNRSVKENTGKTTSQIIAERMLQEAKILLKYSPLNVSEIAYALGFTETTHFNNFFKKHAQLSPLRFRKV